MQKLPATELAIRRCLVRELLGWQCKRMVTERAFHKLSLSLGVGYSGGFHPVNLGGTSCAPLFN